MVDLRHVAGQPGSWKVTDYHKPFGGWAGATVRWARGADGSAGRLIMGTVVVSTGDLATMDADDGLDDGVVDLQYVAARPKSWDIDTRQLTPIGDIDGDGRDDLLAARVDSRGLEGYLFSPSILPGVAAFWGSPPARWLRLLVLPDSPIAQFFPGMVGIAAAWRVGAVAASSAGDVDGDGLGDFLLGDPGLSVDRPAGMVFLAMSADLGTVDRVDGRTDSRLLLANFPGDADADGFPNPVDRDDDADGVADDEDAFPLDPAESADTDSDGVGNNADAFPSDLNEAHDNDGDGVGDNADPDDDNDGTLDTDDHFPFDSSASTDTDGDGVDDSRDAFPDNPAEGADADGADGVRDGSIEIERALSQTGSWILRSGQLGYSASLVSALGDINRDRIPELYIGARSSYSDAIILSGADLHAADAADGTVDRAIELWQVSWRPKSWWLQGHRLGDVPRMPFSYDMSGDNGPDLLIGQPGAGNGDLPGLVQVIPQYILRRLDRQDSVIPGGVVRLHLVGGLELWRLSGEAGGDEAGTSLAMDYFNADPRADLVVSAPGNGQQCIDGCRTGGSVDRIHRHAGLRRRWQRRRGHRL